MDVQLGSSKGGENYGWNVVEGLNHCFAPPTGCNLTGKVPPVIDYAHSVGSSITGGFVYRGCTLPDIDGTYFYSDYASSRTWSFDYACGTMTNPQTRTLTGISNPSSYGEDGAGELYILNLNAGTVYQFVAQ